MKIVDMHAEPLQACCTFEFRGFTVSASTVFTPHSVMVLDASGQFIGGEQCTVEQALAFINDMVLA